MGDLIECPSCGYEIAGASYRAAPPADGELLVRSDADVRREALEEAAKIADAAVESADGALAVEICYVIRNLILARARAAALEQDRKEGE